MGLSVVHQVTENFGEKATDERKLSQCAYDFAAFFTPYLNFCSTRRYFLSRTTMMRTAHIIFENFGGFQKD